MAPPPINRSDTDRARASFHDPGQLYELVHEVCSAGLAEADQQSLTSQDSLHNLLKSVKQDPEVKEHLDQYVRIRGRRGDGPISLAKHAKEAAYDAPLLRALASAAAEMVARVTAGAEVLLTKNQLLPQVMLQDFTTCTAAATKPSHATSRSKSSRSCSSRLLKTCHTTPPSWLHPLLHQLRPDQVVLLVSQLLLCLAGVLDPRWVALQTATRELPCFDTKIDT
jgi:hypothetical protein